MLHQIMREAVDIYHHLQQHTGSDIVTATLAASVVGAAAIGLRESYRHHRKELSEFYHNFLDPLNYGQ